MSANVKKATGPTAIIEQEVAAAAIFALYQIIEAISALLLLPMIASMQFCDASEFHYTFRRDIGPKSIETVSHA
jgi:hypothetical protein